MAKSLRVLAMLGALGGALGEYYQCSVPATDTAACKGAIDDAAVAPGFCVSRFHGDIRLPRGLLVVPGGDILVVERVDKDLGSAKIVKLFDADGDNVAEGRVDLVAQPGLNHGLAYLAGHIYASSSTTVYRWPFVSGSLDPITTSPETVVHSMNADGQVTRA